MLVALQKLACQYDFGLKQVDIEGNADLEQRYGEYIPVLIAADSGTEICHYHLESRRFIDSLNQ